MADWSPLRTMLTDVEHTITIAWDELDWRVSGLPRSAFVHDAFWKGDRSGWPGFTTNSVVVGQSVTFVRKGALQRMEVPARPIPPHVTNADPDLILIGA